MIQRYGFDALRAAVPVHRPEAQAPALDAPRGTPARTGGNSGDAARVLERARKYLAAIPGAVKGNRSAEGYRVAAKLRRGFALPDADAWALMRSWNALNSPPLDEEELRSVFDNGLKYGKEAFGEKADAPRKSPAHSSGSEPARIVIPADAALDIRAFNLTDSGNAELFARLYGDRLRYDHRQGRWLLWAGNWWTADADGELHRLAKQAMRERYRLATDLEDTVLRIRQAKFSISSENRARLDSVLALAQNEAPIADAGDGWDSDPMLLGVLNGVVDLRTGTLRPGRAEDRITMHLDIPFDADAMRDGAERWIRFVLELFQDDAAMYDFLWRSLGYTLTGDTREQVLFVLYGSGANGKSTLLSTLRHVLGPYAHDAGFSTFELNGRASIPSDLAALCGRRFVSASECSEGVRLNEERVKALTGGDSITARFMYRDLFTFRPTCKIWLATNHKPRIADDSFAFWRRVRLIPFLAQFTGEKADKHLEETLHGEAVGVLAWIVRGCLEWQRRGLDAPEAVATATRQYEAESDPLNEFLSDCCILGDGYHVLSASLYRAYLAWADQQGVRDRERLTRASFGRRIGERFTRGRPKGEPTRYSGIGLLTSEGA